MAIEQEFAASLQARIKYDLGPRFPNVGWDGFALGDLYSSPDAQTGLIVIDRMLGDVLARVLKQHGLMLTDAGWRNFVHGVTVATTPKQVIPMMVSATAAAVPLPVS